MESVLQNTVTHGCHRFGNILAFEQFIALCIDDLTLVVGDIIIFQELLADIEVSPFDFALRRLKRTRDHRVLNRFALRHFQAFHDRFQPVAGKNA